MKFAMPRLTRRRPQHSRSFVRYEGQIDTAITLIDRMVSMEGRVLDLSRGGALFRPRLAYIMRRTDEPICIRLGAEELFGHIVSTSPKGFSVRFDDPIDEPEFDELIAQFKLTPPGQAAA